MNKVNQLVPIKTNRKIIRERFNLTQKHLYYSLSIMSIVYTYRLYRSIYNTYVSIILYLLVYVCVLLSVAVFGTEKVKNGNG